MSFVRGRRPVRHMSGFGDSPGYNNPDGTPTYDSAPYDPLDPFNPYNDGISTLYTLPTVYVSSSGPPATIPLQTTDIGWGTLGPTPQNTLQPVGVTSTGLPAITSPVSSGTSWLQSLTSIFTPATPASTPTYLAPSGSVYRAPVQQASLVGTGGMSTSTMLLLAAGVLGAVLLAKKKGASV